MAKKRIYKGKPCAYCPEPSTTRDHVIARKSVRFKYRDGLPIVPSCSSCNTEKSKLEEYVKALIGVGSLIPENTDYFKEVSTPSLHGNRKHFTLLRDGLRQVVIPRPDGTIGPDCFHTVMDFDFHKLYDLCKYIASGLYYHHFGEPLLQRDSFFDVHHPDYRNEALNEYNSILSGPNKQVHYRKIGGGAFSYKGGRTDTHPHASVWLMDFHNMIAMKDPTDSFRGRTIVVTTMPKALGEDI